MAAPVTFRDLYNDPTMDPYNGNYDPVMALFQVGVGAHVWDAPGLLTSVSNTGIGYTYAYVGLFPYDGEDAGRTRLLHAPNRFPPVMGRPTPYDNNLYCFVDDVTAGTVQSVVFPTDPFVLAAVGAGTIVPATINDATTLWGADPNLTVLDTLVVGADTTTTRVPYIMYVPAVYVHLFIGRRLTPRQLVVEVLATVATDGGEANLQPFVQWCMMAGCAEIGGADQSALLIPDDVTIPFGDPLFLGWRYADLHALLPALAGAGAGASAAATVRIAGLMGNLLKEQQDARADANAARAISGAAKSVSDYFKAHVTLKLTTLCDVARETDLPEVWTNLAAANGKREREVLDEHFRDVASRLDVPELSPIITPTLSKKITSMRFGGSNLDDLSEGVNPFVVVIMDHTTSSGSQAYQEALSAANDYDDLTRGSGAADLADLKTIRASTKVLIPETFALGRAMMQSYRIVLMGLLGDNHKVVVAYSSFLTGYVNRENFFMGRLQRADAHRGVARLLRYIQLIMRAWFENMWNATPAVAALVGVPDFKGPLNKMMVGDMTWLPELPTVYCSAPSAPSGGTSEGQIDKEKRSKSKLVRNVKPNGKFEEFKTSMNKVKFNDIISKVGSPPKVKRKGKEVPMCASYHLRGSCFDTCTRASDHGPHSEAEDTELYEWCKTAFE